MSSSLFRLSCLISLKVLVFSCSRSSESGFLNAPSNESERLIDTVALPLKVEFVLGQQDQIGFYRLIITNPVASTGAITPNWSLSEVGPRIISRKNEEFTRAGESFVVQIEMTFNRNNTNPRGSNSTDPANSMGKNSDISANSSDSSLGSVNSENRFLCGSDQYNPNGFLLEENSDENIVCHRLATEVFQVSNNLPGIPVNSAPADLSRSITTDTLQNNKTINSSITSSANINVK